MSSLSGQGDYLGIKHWLKQSRQPYDLKIQLVHGDLGALGGMRDHLRHTTTFNVDVAGYHNILTI